MKRFIALVGPRGAGRSTIGQLLATELGIHSLRVEPLFLEVRERLGATHPDYERTGFERIAVRPLGVLSPGAERLFLEARFRAVWASGWKRLRRQAGSAAVHSATVASAGAVRG